MIIKNLELYNFRNYPQQEIEFSPHRNLITGRNAQGKTNLLEAIYFLSYLKPKRAPRLRDLLKHGEKECSVKGVVEEGGESFTIKAVLSHDRRYVEINGRRVEKASRGRGVLKCVLFAPEDLYLVKGEPARRREFMDETIEALGARGEVVQRYRHALRQRNAVLKKWEEYGAGAAAAVSPWTEGLVEAGAKIILARIRMVGEMSGVVSGAYAAIAADEKKADMLYKGSFTAGESDLESIELSMREALVKAERDEKMAGTTLVGPHRDDVRIELEGMDARHSASQGEQRTLAYSMRIAQLRHLEAETLTRPVLLLDDVLSELDEERRKKVLHLAGEENQAIITATEAPAESWEGGAKTFLVDRGRISVERA